MKKLYAILFVFLSISIISISNLKKDEIVGWYYYNGEDTSVIEFTEPEVSYIGKDSKGYYEIKYKNKLLKEKNNPNLRICKEDSRNHTTEEFRYLESSDIKNDEYSRKLTKQEENNVKKNLKTAKQSEEICNIG